MKKQLTERTVYEPNKKVKITVQNKPFDSESLHNNFERTVTIKVDMGLSKDKIVFATDDDIATFLEGIDVEDPQTSLDLEKEK